MLAAVTLLMTMSPLAAQQELPQLQKAETNPFVDVRDVKAAKVETAPTAVNISEIPQDVVEQAMAEQQQQTREIVENMLTENGVHFKAPAAYVPTKTEEEHPLTFIGSLQVAFYNENEFYTPYGMYRFSTKNGLKREKYGKIDAILDQGVTYVGSKLEGMSNYTIPDKNDGRFYYSEIDIDTWLPTANSMKRANYDICGNIAYNPVDNKVYAILNPEDWTVTDADLAIIDLPSQTKENIVASIGYSENNVKAFAINDKGEGYLLVKGTTNKIVKLDLATGATTDLLTITENLYFALQSMCFDDRGLLYLCVSTGDEESGMMSAIFEINVEEATYRILGYLPEGEEYTALRVIYEPADGCPAAIDDLTAQFTDATMAGNISFTMPTQTVGGQSLTDDVTYTITIDDVELKSATAAAGAAINETFSVETEGLHKVVVVLKNSVGESVRNVSTAFAGQDTPIAHDVTLDIVEGQATVAWTANTGEHNGYVDQTNLKFNVVRMPEGVKVAEGISELSFTESLKDMNYAGYSYDVIAINGEQAGQAVRSNVVRYGAAWPTPYICSLSSEYDINNFDVIDQNADGNTWFVTPVEESTGWNQRLVYQADHGSNMAADDWAITPAVKMRNGYAYQLSFKGSSITPAKTERMAVAYGEGNDPATYTEIMEAQDVEGLIRDMKDYAFDMKIHKDGEYRFAFHALSDAHMSSLFVDDIKVVEVAALDAPAAAANLVATPAEEGELIATVEFDAPTTTFDGAPLASITKVELIRDGEEVAATLTEVTPGQHVSMTDEDAVNGFTTYSVIIYNEAGASVPVESSIYVGEDIPFAPRNVVVIDNLDGTATMNWEAPESVGQNGGFVATDELLYNTYKISSSEGLVPMAENVEGMAFLIEEIEDAQYQEMRYFGVEAYNELGTSELTQGSMIVGPNHGLPFMEGFVAGDLAELWYYDCSEYKNGFNMYSGIETPDGDGQFACYQAEEIGNWSTLHSGKITIEGAENPMLVFAYLNTPNRNNKLTVSVRRSGELEEDILFEKDFSSATGQMEWNYEKISLDAYKDTKYLLFSFKAEINDKNLPLVAFDDMNVRDVKTNDLAASIKAQGHAEAGQKVAVSTTIHNIGSDEASGFTVNLYFNGNKVAEAEGAKVASFGRVGYEFSVPTSLGEKELSEAYVEVVYESDNNLADNTTDVANIIVARPLLNGVDDLTASANNGTVSLTWSAVSTDHNVTESFEGYDSFLINGFGAWTTYDADGTNNSPIFSANYAHAYEAFAWMTFDFSALGVDIEESPWYAGNTGTQCVTSMRSRYYECDDWLISPELSGEAQTISLYARTQGALFGSENLEVLYSTTGNATTDFTETATKLSVSESDYTLRECELPAGAKYFALRNNTQYGGMLMVDDISYVGVPLTLKGYNVYRDGELIGTVDATVTSFDDASTTSHTYNVTAVFEEGESGFSNDVIVEGTTGIENVINGETEGDVYDLSGRKLIQQQRGVNIVRYGNLTKKVVRK